MRKCRYKQFIFYPFSKLRGFIPGKYCFSLCYTNARLPLKRNLFPRKWIRAWMHALVGSGRGQGLKILIPQRFFVLPSHKWTYVNTSQSHVRWDKQISYSWNLTSCSAAVLPADIYIISYNLIHSCRRTNFTAAMWIFHYPISRGSYHLKDPWFLISRLGGLSSSPGFLVRGWGGWWQLLHVWHQVCVTNHLTKTCDTEKQYCTLLEMKWYLQRLNVRNLSQLLTKIFRYRYNLNLFSHICRSHGYPSLSTGAFYSYRDILL